jgi:hypothetical protein
MNDAFAAVNRSDAEIVLLGYEPDVRLRTHGWEATGIKAEYRGHPGALELFAALDEEFSEWGWNIRGLVDGGDRVAVRADFTARGRSSGADVTLIDAGTAFHLSHRGKVAHQHWCVGRDGWQQALDAVGLSES